MARLERHAQWSPLLPLLLPPAALKPLGQYQIKSGLRGHGPGPGHQGRRLVGGRGREPHQSCRQLHRDRSELKAPLSLLLLNKEEGEGGGLSSLRQGEGGGLSSLRQGEGGVLSSLRQGEHSAIHLRRDRSYQIDSLLTPLVEWEGQTGTPWRL